MRKMCTLITSKGTDIDENIANQNHATCTRTPKPGYLNLSIIGKEEIGRRCGVVDIVEKVREARLRWYGHVIRRDEGELVRDIIK